MGRLRGLLRSFHVRLQGCLPRIQGGLSGIHRINQGVGFHEPNCCAEAIKRALDWPYTLARSLEDDEFGCERKRWCFISFPSKELSNMAIRITGPSALLHPTRVDITLEPQKTLEPSAQHKSQGSPGLERSTRAPKGPQRSTARLFFAHSQASSRCLSPSAPCRWHVGARQWAV